MKPPAKKIFFSSPNLNAGGAQRHLINIINGLQDKDFNISLFLYEKKGELINDLNENIKLYHPVSFPILHKLKIFRFLIGTIDLIRFVKKEKPDFLYSRHWTKITNLLAGKILNIKTICGEGNNIKHSLILSKKRLRFQLRKMAIQHSDIIVANSISLSKEIKDTFQPKSDVVVIPNGIEFKKIHTLSKQNVHHSWFNKDTPLIISIGRLVKQKDFVSLLKSFHILNQSTDARLLIIGDGKLKNDLIKQTKQLSIKDKIDFISATSNPFAYISKADIFVSSSIFEGLSNSILEAMALGLPVVSTDHKHGANEIIDHNKNGILVPVGNSSKLADAILKILNDKELKLKLKEEAPKKARLFSIENMIRNYEDLFNKMQSS